MSAMQIYGSLTGFYHLLDPLEDHEDEASDYRAAAERFVPTAKTLLELGTGAGNNAHFLKERFRCTLTDLSPEMLALSQAQNPECPHLLGDMRTLRLGQTFDVVFAHDAICYMASREDLRRVAETAYVHLRPGGAAIFAPDSVREGFHEWTALHQNDDGQRSLRCMEWTWDPDAEDETCVTDFAFLLREDGAVRSVHDRHVFGLFDTSTWRSILEGVGFRAETVKRASLDTSEPYTDQIFVGLK